jgi:molecular chaperone DnaK
VQADVDALKSALAGEDDDAVKTAFDKLSESQQKIGQALYAQGQADTAAGASSDETPAEDAAPSNDDEDIVDAEVVDDEETK